MGRMTKRLPSAAIIGGNDDLLTEILVLLPAKSVVRFKSVSKHLLSLISSDSFSRLHVQNHGRRRAAETTQHSFMLSDADRSQFFLCYPTIKKLVQVSLPDQIKHRGVKLLKSSNGLLLLSLEKDFVVFNPTTKQYRFIHRPDEYQPFQVCLLFDPWKSEHYKIVVRSTITSFLVYDSATHQWSHGGRDYHFITRPDHNRNHIACSLILGNNSSLAGYTFWLNEHFFDLQMKEEQNKRCFSLGVKIDGKWVRSTLDFDSKLIGLLVMMREERIEDSAFLFQTPGRLFTCKFSRAEQEVLDVEELVDYRSDNFYVQDQLQFRHFFPFIHTFASI